MIYWKQQAAAGAKSTASLGETAVTHELRAANKRVAFVFHNPLELREGDRLALEV